MKLLLEQWKASCNSDSWKCFAVSNLPHINEWEADWYNLSPHFFFPSWFFSALSFLGAWWEKRGMGLETLPLHPWIIEQQGNVGGDRGACQETMYRDTGKELGVGPTSGKTQDWSTRGRKEQYDQYGFIVWSCLPPQETICSLSMDHLLVSVVVMTTSGRRD